MKKKSKNIIKQNRNNTKQNKNTDFFDMSYRNKIDFNIPQERYTDEELSILINELQKDIEHLKILHQKYYSTNSYIERIQKRNFFDILHEKIAYIIYVTFANLVLKIKKRKTND